MCDFLTVLGEDEALLDGDALEELTVDETGEVTACADAWLSLLTAETAAAAAAAATAATFRAEIRSEADELW